MRKKIQKLSLLLVMLTALFLSGCQQKFNLSQLTKKDKLILTRVYIDPVVYNNAKKNQYEDSIQLAYTLKTQELAYIIGFITRLTKDLAQKTPFNLESAIDYKDHPVYRQLPERAKFPGYISLPPFKSIKLEQKAPRSLLLNGFKAEGLASLWIQYYTEFPKKAFVFKSKTPVLITEFKFEFINLSGKKNSFLLKSKVPINQEVPHVFSLTGNTKNLFINGFKEIQKSISSLSFEKKE